VAVGGWCSFLDGRCIQSPCYSLLPGIYDVASGDTSGGAELAGPRTQSIIGSWWLRDSMLLCPHLACWEETCVDALPGRSSWRHRQFPSNTHPGFHAYPASLLLLPVRDPSEFPWAFVNPYVLGSPRVKRLVRAFGSVPSEWRFR
jgi:hypothetical protein